MVAMNLISSLQSTDSIVQSRGFCIVIDANNKWSKVQSQQRKMLSATSAMDYLCIWTQCVLISTDWKWKLGQAFHCGHTVQLIIWLEIRHLKNSAALCTHSGCDLNIFISWWWWMAPQLQPNHLVSIPFEDVLMMVIDLEPYSWGKFTASEIQIWSDMARIYMENAMLCGPR